MYPRRQSQVRVPLQAQEAAAVRLQREADTEHVHAAIEAEQRRTLLILSQFAWLSFGVLEGLIALRILLRLIAANPSAPFAEFIYAVTAPFLWPFMGLTTTPAANGIELEIHSNIAMLVYALASVLVERLIRIIFSRPRV
jgi:hypothetical protein